MCPRNADFPDYKGISVSHADNWNSIDYHKPKGSASKEQKEGGFQPVRGMVSNRKRRVVSPEPSQDTIDKTTKAAREDWKQRGLSNNEITDY